jgi:hypothetical protein
MVVAHLSSSDRFRLAYETAGVATYGNAGEEQDLRRPTGDDQL